MRIVSVSSLRGEEILGKQIYDDAGRVLLNVGVKLSSFYIRKLNDLGIYSVYIDDALSKEIIIEENISDKTRQLSKHAVKEMIDKYSREGKTDNNGVVKSVNSIIEDVLLNKNVMISVSEMRATDNNIYSHSENVCVLSTIIGIHMGYNMFKLRDIAVGALLHDIGKARIKQDKKIIDSIKDKNELEKYIDLNHSKVGYDFLGKENMCTAYSKIAVLMHHERIDGSGYPLKLKGEEINESAKLVAICDAFDNMVSGKGEQRPKAVYEVIEYLVGMSGYQFDAEVVKKFTANIAAFPNGSGVKLNTKEICLVVRQNESMPMRPVVKVIFDGSGDQVWEPYEINLMKELTIFIIGICEI